VLVVSSTFSDRAGSDRVPSASLPRPSWLLALAVHAIWALVLPAYVVAGLALLGGSSILGNVIDWFPLWLAYFAFLGLITSVPNVGLFLLLRRNSRVVQSRRAMGVVYGVLWFVLGTGLWPTDYLWGRVAQGGYLSVAGIAYGVVVAVVARRRALRSTLQTT
jgi:hypothetical protein